MAIPWIMAAIQAYNTIGGLYKKDNNINSGSDEYAKEMSSLLQKPGGQYSAIDWSMPEQKTREEKPNEINKALQAALMSIYGGQNGKV